MTSSTMHQAETVSERDRLADAVSQAEVLCNIEGEQSEVCQFAHAYVEAVRSEMTESVELEAQPLERQEPSLLSL